MSNLRFDDESYDSTNTVFFSKSIRLRFIRFKHFFENVFGLSHSFFQTNKVKVIRFSKRIHLGKTVKKKNL